MQAFLLPLQKKAMLASKPSHGNVLRAWRALWAMSGARQGVLPCQKHAVPPVAQHLTCCWGTPEMRAPNEPVKRLKLQNYPWMFFLKLPKTRWNSALSQHFTVIARSSKRTGARETWLCFWLCQSSSAQPWASPVPSPCLPLPTRPSSELCNSSRNDLLQCRSWLGLHK